MQRPCPAWALACAFLLSMAAPGSTTYGEILPAVALPLSWSEYACPLASGLPPSCPYEQNWATYHWPAHRPTEPAYDYRSIYDPVYDQAVYGSIARGEVSDSADSGASSHPFVWSDVARRACSKWGSQFIFARADVVRAAVDWLAEHTSTRVCPNPLGAVTWLAHVASPSAISNPSGIESRGAADVWASSDDCDRTATVADDDAAWHQEDGPSEVVVAAPSRSQPPIRSQPPSRSVHGPSCVSPEAAHSMPFVYDECPWQHFGCWDGETPPLRQSPLSGETPFARGASLAGTAAISSAAVRSVARAISPRDLLMAAAVSLRETGYALQEASDVLLRLSGTTDRPARARAASATRIER